MYFSTDCYLNYVFMFTFIFYICYTNMYNAFHLNLIKEHSKKKIINPLEKTHMYLHLLLDTNLTVIREE